MWIESLASTERWYTRSGVVLTTTINHCKPWCSVLTIIVDSYQPSRTHISGTFGTKKRHPESFGTCHWFSPISWLTSNSTRTSTTKWLVSVYGRSVPIVLWLVLPGSSPSFLHFSVYLGESQFASTKRRSRRSTAWHSVIGPKTWGAPGGESADPFLRWYSQQLWKSSQSS